MKNLITRVIAVALTTAGLVWLWLNEPGLIVIGFDANLAAVKFFASLVPVPYGAMSEVALRGLGADKVLFFAEGRAVVKLAFWLIARMFRRASSQNANEKKEVNRG